MAYEAEHVRLVHRSPDPVAIIAVAAHSSRTLKGGIAVPLFAIMGKHHRYGREDWSNWWEGATLHSRSLSDSAPVLESAAKQENEYRGAAFNSQLRPAPMKAHAQARTCRTFCLAGMLDGHGMYAVDWYA